MAEPRPTRTGFGRVLVAVYATFALAATARAAVQLLTQYSEAPLAYLLSAVSAVIYVVATVALAGRGPRPRAVALAAVSFELIGVLLIGTLSVLDPAAFPDQTVWSGYGQGYVYIPLVLPFVGLYWLYRTAGRVRG